MVALFVLWVISAQPIIANGATLSFVWVMSGELCVWLLLFCWLDADRKSFALGFLWVCVTLAYPIKWICINFGIPASYGLVCGLMPFNLLLTCLGPARLARVP